MIDPTKDGRLALRIREIAEMEADSVVSEAGGERLTLTAAEKARILNIAADVLEEYIMAASPNPSSLPTPGAHP